MEMDPTQRFSSRVENYVKYRPRYPNEVIGTLRKECTLVPSSRIADIGSGTGALTELFLQNGNEVFAVEPNREMRSAAEHHLQKFSGFHSIEGRAEATNLDNRSVDFAVIGQAYHWFDIPETRREFLRILKSPGWAMVVWNVRDLETAPFMIAYDRLLKRFAPEYAREKHKRVYDTTLAQFFGDPAFSTRAISYRQELDFEGLKGRVLSSSYSPEAGHPNYEPMISELYKIYQEFQIDGRVTLEYITWMYFSRLID